VEEAMTEAGWRALLAPRLVLILCVLLGGVLLHSMNVLITATLLPSIVAEMGGANLMSWPTTAFVASSIVAASGTSLVSTRFGNRRSFAAGALVYAAGAVLCAAAPSIGFVIAGRFVQGLGGGLISALAYVLVRNAFPEVLWPRVFGLHLLRLRQISAGRPAQRLLHRLHRHAHRKGGREHARRVRRLHRYLRHQSRGRGRRDRPDLL
jgi:MFS family permease